MRQHAASLDGACCTAYHTSVQRSLCIIQPEVSGASDLGEILLFEDIFCTNMFSEVQES